MDKGKKWLIWALCVFGLGLIISMSTTALLKTATDRWVMLPPAIWWEVMVGLVLSWLCTVAGIGLAVVGLRMLVSK